MSFSMSGEHFRYAVKISESDPAIEQFFTQLNSRGAADTAEKLRGIRDSLFETHILDDFSEADVQSLRSAMLRILTLAFSSLYAASGERVPEKIWEIFEEQTSDYSDYEVMQKRYDRFASLGPPCYALLESCMQELGFHGLGCEHGVGVILSLTDAWVTAYEREKAAKANSAAASEWGKKGISPSVASDLLEALEGNDDSGGEAR